MHSQKNIFGFLLLTLTLSGFFSFLSPSVLQDDQPMSLDEFHKRIARQDKAVLVYFHADWCTVCAKMNPMIEQLEQEHKETVEFLKLDSDKNKEIAEEFGITALPVMVHYRNGKRNWIHVGMIEKSKLKEKLK